MNTGGRNAVRVAEWDGPAGTKSTLKTSVLRTPRPTSRKNNLRSHLFTTVLALSDGMRRAVWVSFRSTKKAQNCRANTRQRVSILSSRITQCSSSSKEAEKSCCAVPTVQDPCIHPQCQTRCGSRTPHDLVGVVDVRSRRFPLVKSALWSDR